MAEKITCNTAQDLMPLLLDGACSEDSRQAVEAHVAACPACDQYYQQMQQSALPHCPNAQIDQSFTKALKRKWRKNRAWRLAALVCAVIIALSGLYFTVLNPDPLLSIRGEAPVAWFQNARLVRTSQGAILLQFTPSESYRHFFGRSSAAYTNLPDSQMPTYTLAYEYPALARIFNRDYDTAQYVKNYQWAEQGGFLRLSNGDWAVSPAFLPFLTWETFSWRYVDGEIRCMTERELTGEEIKALVTQGAPVESYTTVFVYDADWSGQESFQLQLRGPDGRLTVYQSGQDIPLCDEELQAIFDEMLTSNPTLLPQEGDILSIPRKG